jgi:hypothetical protein
MARHFKAHENLGAEEGASVVRTQISELSVQRRRFELVAHPADVHSLPLFDHGRRSRGERISFQSRTVLDASR